MEDYTVSSLLSMSKSLRNRLSQLNELKNSVTTRTVWSDPKKTEEPTYNIKEVDKKITKINNALFKIDNAIKLSNATTKVNIKIDYDDLTSSLD